MTVIRVRRDLPLADMDERPWVQPGGALRTAIKHGHCRSPPFRPFFGKGGLTPAPAPLSGRRDREPGPKAVT